MVNEVGADLRVTAGLAGEQHFRSHAIGAGHQDRLPVSVDIQREQPAEGPPPAQHSGPLGALGHGFNQSAGTVPGTEAAPPFAIGVHVGTVPTAALSTPAGTGTGP